MLIEIIFKYFTTYFGMSSFQMIEYRKGGEVMKWEDVRQAFPNQWVLIEAIRAFTNGNSERILE